MYDKVFFCELNKVNNEMQRLVAVLMLKPDFF